jgi:signal transduction histidine kinase
MGRTSPTTDPRPAFTLRFRDEETHRTLRLTSELLGVSMNELAEQAIAHELAQIGADLEDRLRRTADLLGKYRGGDTEREIDEFARAEVTEDDPLRSRKTPVQDPLGVSAVFARPLERG